MGCFSSPETPQMKVPERVELPKAQDLFQEGIGTAKQIAPLAYGAREGALSDISTPESAMDYYGGFGPTSFEEALGNQYFENVWPGMEREIKHGLSLSGIESSPILAQQLGQARGEIGFDIGSYLSNLGQQRASESLGYRMGIDPMNMVRGYVDPALSQSQAQGGYDWQRSQARAEAQYINELNEFNREQAFAKQMGFLLGPIGAWGFGGPEAGVGELQNIASTIGFGERYDPYSPNMGGGGVSQYGNVYGGNTPYGAQDMGSYSAMPMGGGGSQSGSIEGLGMEGGIGDILKTFGQAGQALAVF